MKIDMKIIAKLVMHLGEVDRITRHPDGVTFETVTTHSVMLALVAYELAFSAKEPLDLEKVLLYSLLHDLPEGMPGVGDTATLKLLSEEEKATKEERERLGMTKAVDWLEGAGCDLIAGALVESQRLNTPEARFVKAVDKLMPKLTHLLNEGAVLVYEGLTPEQLDERLLIQRKELEEGYAHDFPEVVQLHDELRTQVVDLLRTWW